MNDIALHVETVEGVSLDIADNGAVALDVGGSMYAVGPPYYDGSYEVTPSSQTQVIPMEGMRARHDVTVNPIPSNYGLITWNGSTLTVS